VLAFSDPHLFLEHFEVNHQYYRVVISDYRMPEMNGIELLEKTKSINSSVLRMMVSAFEIQDQVFGSCNCVDKFLQKPIKMSDIKTEVQKQMNSIKIQNKG